MGTSQIAEIELKIENLHTAIEALRTAKASRHRNRSGAVRTGSGEGRTSAAHVVSAKSRQRTGPSRSGSHQRATRKQRGSVVSTLPRDRCGQSEVTCAYAARALAASEIAAAEAHIAACPDCQRELESLRQVVDRFVSWPTDVLRPAASLQARLALRIAE